MGQIGEIFQLIFTQPIFNVLMLLYNLFGSLALSIIILTLIVRLAMFPLTLKQLKSTKATQAIQPLIADVRKNGLSTPAGSIARPLRPVLCVEFCVQCC